MADPNRRQQFAALEKEWMAQDVDFAYVNWLQHELVKARAAQSSSADLETLAREIVTELTGGADNFFESRVKSALQLLTSTLGTK